MDYLKMEKDIHELMKENHINCEVVKINKEDKMIGVEILWGDWKHEHLRFDGLMEENFNNIRKIYTVTTEEDGTDCYSAIHYCYFK